MNGKIQLTLQMFIGALFILMVLISACNPVDVEERVAMTLTALFTFQPTITSTATPESVPTETATLILFSSPTPSSTFTLAPSPTFTETPKPSCFKLLNPVDGAYLPSIGKVSFEWEPFSGAEKYRLEISASYHTPQVFETTDTSVTRYLATLPWEGPYDWQVTAMKANGETLCVVGLYSFNKPKFRPTSTPKPEEPSRFVIIKTPEGTPCAP